MKPDHESNIDYNKITDDVFIGTNMCCQTHFEEELLKQGITADLSLEENRVDSPFGVDFYMWLPTKDHFPPNDDQIECGIAFLEKLEKKGRKVYMHCKNGHGRAPTMFMAYLIAKKGVSFKEAFDLVQSKRNSIHLHDPQKEALKDIESHYAGK